MGPPNVAMLSRSSRLTHHGQGSMHIWKAPKVIHGSEVLRPGKARLLIMTRHNRTGTDLSPVLIGAMLISLPHARGGDWRTVSWRATSHKHPHRLHGRYCIHFIRK